MIDKVFDVIAKERPVGTAANDEILDILEKRFKDMNYSVRSLPFDCVVWEKGKSVLTINNQVFDIEPSPFSESYEGSGILRIVKTIEELQDTDCNGVILILAGKLTESPLQPKVYPFYYPKEHKFLISLIEQKQPKAIVAATGKTPLNGKDPFPLFEDGNFLIPSGNIREQTLLQIEAMVHSDAAVHLTLNSHKSPAKSRQIIASKKTGKSAGKIVVCAHMDTKYNTPGALDNASGVAVMLQVAKALEPTRYDIDLLPFNSEEFYGACGELEYLKRIDRERDRIVLMVNIDSPCHKGAQTAISVYNLKDSMNQITNRVMNRSSRITKGQEWYAGDHTPFIARGIPCLVATSSDFFSGALEYAHTPKDTLDTIDFDMVNNTAKYLVEVITVFSAQVCD